MDLRTTVNSEKVVEEFEISDVDPKGLTAENLKTIISAFFHDENNEINKSNEINPNAYRFTIEKLLQERDELKNQNTVLQKRNTELVEKNRELKQQLKNDVGDECQFMFCTEPKFK